MTHPQHRPHSPHAAAPFALPANPGVGAVELDPLIGADFEAYLVAVNEGYLTRWGRAMRPGDPVFPNWEADEPVALTPAQMEALVVNELLEAGTDPADVYAYTHTGVLVTDQNRHLIPAADAQEFDVYVRRYRNMHAPLTRH